MLSYLYLDIETAPAFDSKKEYLRLRDMILRGDLTPQSDPSLFYKVKNGALNPHEGKVIVISYAHDNDSPQMLKEWESSEQAILQEFHSVLDKATRETASSGKHLTYVGFNIIQYDLPFLFCRMQSYRMDDPKWLYKKLFHFSADLMQMHLPLNDYDFTGLTHDALCSAYEVDTKGTTGDMIIDWYYEEKYAQIEDYVRSEFVHNRLFKKILSEGLVEKGKLKLSVKTVLEKRRAPEGPVGWRRAAIGARHQ